MAPHRLLLCPVCTFPNRLTADALEMHLAMKHYPECLPYPCITGCRGTMRFPTEAALRRHCLEEHRLTNYEVSFQLRNEDERFQVGRIRTHLRNALAEINPKDGDDDEGDVKFLGPTTSAAATKVAMGGMNEAGGSIPATTSTSASTRVMTPQPLEASAATSAAPNIASEANVSGMTSGQTASYSSSQSDGRPGNNAAMDINAGRQGQTTTAAATGLSPPSSSSAATASASACAIASGRQCGCEPPGVGRVPSGPAASNSSGTPSSSSQPTQPPSIAPHRLQQRLTSLAAKGPARCTCGVWLNPLKKSQLGFSKIAHVTCHLKIPLYECRLCSSTTYGYYKSELYKHLRKCHQHLRGAPIHELERRCICLLNEEIAGRLRLGLEHYFPTANCT